MTTLIMRRKGNALVPVSPYDEETLGEVAQDKDLTVKITRNRSWKQNRLYHALVQKVAENHPHYRSAKPLEMWLKLRMGYVDDILLHDGQVMPILSSTSFASMGQDEFQKFFNNALTILVEEVLPGVDKDALIKEVEAMTGLEAPCVF